MAWTLNSGTSFYRMMNYVKYMDKLSFGMSKWRPDFQEVSDWEYKIKEEQVARDLHTLMNGCDIAISQKFHSQGGLAVMDCFRDQYPKKPWYTELDDHVFALNPDSAAYDNYNPGSELEAIIREQIQMSTGIITSTEYLRSVYEKINPNVWVVPNGIDFEIWDNLKDKVRKSKKIRIGWAGGGSHVKDLEFVYPAVEKIRKKYKNVEFVLLGGFPPSFKDKSNIKVIRKWYSIDKYPQALKDMHLDIAIAPLRDNPFNRGKSNLRWLEYSALKIPTIASNVLPFKSIKNGEDGVLVTEPDEWVDAMSELIDDEGKRKRIGQAAYKRVLKDFNVKKIASDYTEKIHQMIRGKVNISKNVVVEAFTGGGNGRV